MISDFFYPNMGGVENHLFNLSQCLMDLGHKVVLVTHAYKDFNGVRWFSRGLKVYYLPIPVMYNQSTVPTFYCSITFLRCIFIRERITHVHGHQGIFHARLMGLSTTFTDHSLFGFADTSSILVNKLLKFTLSGVDNIICVSNTSKENTVLRASLDPERVFVIPNAVVSEQFTPDPTLPEAGFITIVILCRLVYRKGVDLLVAVIPRICATHPKVKFLIAGDGPKKVDLEQMRDEHMLHDRVRLIGAVASEEARNVMVRGQIFLNTSLTEAFCMAIVEAASCGLLVVSTKVGGIPEVLPKHMILLSRPDEDHLVDRLGEAIHLIQSNAVDTSTFHQQVSKMYSWHDVAARAEVVYQLSEKGPARDNSLLAILSDFYGCGEFFGKVGCLMVMFDFLLLFLLAWLMPPESIDIAPDFDHSKHEECTLAEIQRQDRLEARRLARAQAKQRSLFL